MSSLLPNSHRHFYYKNTDCAKESLFFSPAIYNISYLDYINNSNDKVPVFDSNFVHYYMMGVHPWDTNLFHYNEDEFNRFRETIKMLTKENGIVGIGEIGVDFSKGFKADLEQQKKWFEAQFEFAITLSLPVTLHVVKAFNFIEVMLKKYRPAIPILFHHISCSTIIAKNLLEMGYCYFSFAPSVFKGKICLSENMRGLIKMVPKERLLIEDEKICANENEVREYEKWFEYIGQLRGTSSDNVKQSVSQNIKSFFTPLRAQY